MDKELGQEYKNPIQREAFLKDNCDACENKGYMKPYTPEELQGHKEKLANVSIEIEELENEKKEAMEIFKGKLKPLQEQRKQMVSNIKAKAEYVTEICYRFTDQETKETGTTTRTANWLRAARRPPMNCNRPSLAWFATSINQQERTINKLNFLNYGQRKIANQPCARNEQSGTCHS